MARKNDVEVKTDEEGVSKRKSASKAQNGNKPDQAAQQPDEQPVDAVLVIRQTSEDGQIGTIVQTVGDVRITEAETLLKLGLKGFQKQIGVE